MNFRRRTVSEREEGFLGEIELTVYTVGDKVLISLRDAERWAEMLKAMHRHDYEKAKEFGNVYRLTQFKGCIGG